MASQERPRHSKQPSTTSAEFNSSALKSKDRPRHRVLIRQFGWYAICALLLGTIVIIACVAFLAFLWAGDERNSTWNRIVIEGWLTRSITIASVLLRSVITIQASVATAMLSALLLHTYSVTLPIAASVSIARYADTAPYSFLWTVIRGRMYGKRKATMGLLSLLLGITMTTVLLQFISTALLSNVGRSTVAETKNLSDVPYGILRGSMRDDRKENAKFVPLAPSAYPAFAEYTEPWNGTSTGGILDTGLSIRAFLPLKSANDRNPMRSYSGMATLMDTRVVCVRPNITNLTFKEGGEDFPLDPYSDRLRGSVTPTVRPERFNLTGSVGFDCALSTPDRSYNKSDPSQAASRSAEWLLTMCSLELSQTGLVSALQPFVDIFHDDFVNGNAFLLINATDVPASPDTPNITIPYRASPVHDKHSVWVDLATPMNASIGPLGLLEPPRSLHFTLCYANLVVRDSKVEARRTFSVSSEPDATWKNATTTYNTQTIRKQLGITKKVYTPQERGIFNLSRQDWEPPQEYRPDKNEITDPQGIVGTIVKEFTMPSTNLLSTLFCVFCIGSTSSTIATSPVVATLFNDVLKDTGNPALALQAFVTVLFSSIYHYQLPEFSATAPATIISDTEVIRPTGWLYFILVNICLGFHFLFVFMISLLYIISDGETLIGNAWSVVAQLQSRECEHWLYTSGNMTDGEVSRSMRSAGKGDVAVGISGQSGVEDYPRIRKRI